MKRRLTSESKRLYAMLLCILTIGVISLTGCGKDDSTSASGNSASDNQTSAISADAVSANEVIMQVEDMELTMKDLYFYFIQYAFNNSITLADIQGDNYETVLSNIMTELKLEAVEYQLALVENIEVDDETMESAMQSADAFYNYFGEEILGKYDITKADVEEFFRRQAYIGMLTKKAQIELADDYYDDYVEQYKDYKFYKVYYVLFPNTETDVSGNTVSINDAQKNDNYEQAVQLHDEIVAAMESGDSSVTLETLAEKYGISDYSKSDYVYNGNYGEELNNALETLQDGEISDVIETDAGYMVFRMDNTDDQDYKDYFLNYMSAQNANNNLPVMQEAWYEQSGVDDMDVNNDLIHTLDMEGMLADLQQLTSGQ